MASSSSSSSSATVRVEKATSDLLIGPDWTLNIDICDSVNSNHWQGKDVVKALKKRLQHKNPKVQLLALTLLETMVKNCGENVHFQIAEKNILQEMIKIVRKKTDMHVRDKILLLLDSWQEAFGGPRGKYPQYYYAYDELRRSGVQFPQRSSDAAPILTPPASHTMGHSQASYGMPRNSSRRLDEAMASEIESLSLSSLDSMRDVMELLSDMLQAVDPNDSRAVKDEVIVDLVSQCRSIQKQLMQMLISTGDEELLSRGLEVNDSLQSLLARHDAIASGLPLPIQDTSFIPSPTLDIPRLDEQKKVMPTSPKPNLVPSVPVAADTRNKIEEDEEEDDFAQLARRHSMPRTVPSQTSSLPTETVPSFSNALTLPDPPAPVRTTKELDMLDDLMSLTLTTTTTSASPHTPHTPHTPSASQNIHQSPSAQVNNPYVSQHYPENQGQASYNSYVVPWAQAQPQLPQQAHSHLRPQYPQYSSAYPPPPWATPPSYANHQNPLPATGFLSPRANSSGTFMPIHGVRNLQSHNSFSGNPTSNISPPMEQKPFVPSYRLFEDLNVFNNVGGRAQTSPSLSGAEQNTMGGRK